MNPLRKFKDWRAFKAWREARRAEIQKATKRNDCKAIGQARKRQTDELHRMLGGAR